MNRVQRSMLVVGSATALVFAGALVACSDQEYLDARNEWCNQNRTSVSLLAAACDDDRECCDKVGWYCDTSKPTEGKSGTCAPRGSNNGPDGGGGTDGGNNPGFDEGFCQGFASACQGSGNCYYTLLTGSQALPPNMDGRKGVAWFQINSNDGNVAYCFSHDVANVTQTELRRGISRMPGTILQPLGNAETKFQGNFRPSDLTDLESRYTHVETRTAAGSPLRGQVIKYNEALFVGVAMGAGTGGAAQVVVNPNELYQIHVQAELTGSEFSRAFVLGNGEEVELGFLQGTATLSTSDVLPNAILDGRAKLEIRDMDGTTIRSSQGLFRQFP